MAPSGANAHARRRRTQLTEYTRQELEPHACVRAVVAVGSVATGQARADSDIDAVVFMDPVDLYVAPAEAIWRPGDNSYHSIFTDDPSLAADGVQLDLHRVDLAAWRAPGFVWPEQRRAELAGGWLVLDRTGGIEQLIRERTAMSDGDRLAVLDEILVAVAGLLPPDPGATWTTLGAVEAFDRLQAAWEGFARGLFAYHRRWRPWRGRSLRGLLQLEHVPSALESSPLTCVQSPDDSMAGYLRRAEVLREVFDELLGWLVADGTYGSDPVSEAFIRGHDEPGRAWNMDEWNRRRHRTG